MKAKNIFQIQELPPRDGEELFELLCQNENLKIKRIISTGQVTPPEKWYDQEKNEWVVLLQGNATLEYENGKVVDFMPGDYIFLPSGTRHRVVFTSANPPCIWLAVYFK